MTPDKYQAMALKTWYVVDNPLHLDPRHPLIKLAGEAGEILDLYGKDQYKPGFSWLKCKHCSRSAKYHTPEGLCEWKPGQNLFANETAYTPLILDELGDYSYYLRILAYQRQVTFENLCKHNEPSQRALSEQDLLCHLIKLSDYSINALKEYYYHNEIVLDYLTSCTYRFLAILAKLDTSLEQVLDLNYRKLNSEPTAHGWKI